VEDTQHGDAVGGGVILVEDDVPGVPTRLFDMMPKYAGSWARTRPTCQRVGDQRLVRLFDQVGVLPVLGLTEAAQGVEEDVGDILLRLLGDLQRSHSATWCGTGRAARGPEP
jgi:hypothetical protein